MYMVIILLPKQIKSSLFASPSCPSHTLNTTCTYFLPNLYPYPQHTPSYSHPSTAIAGQPITSHFSLLSHIGPAPCLALYAQQIQSPLQ
jgi:hypothetical protein